MIQPNHTAANIFGVLGAVLWSVQLIPQLIKSHRSKSTKGLSPWLMVSWMAAGPFLAAYMLLNDANIPLIIQPHAFMFLSSLSWAQCLHYGSRRSLKFTWTFLILVLALAGGVEAAFYFGGKEQMKHGNDGLATAAGALSSAFIILGFFPQFWEIYSYRAVLGISLPFLGMDLAGGVFSILSLLFEPPPFDTVASITYAAVVFLEIIIFILVPILNPAYYRRQAKVVAKEETVGTKSTAEMSEATV